MLVWIRMSEGAGSVSRCAVTDKWFGVSAEGGENTDDVSKTLVSLVLHQPVFNKRQESVCVLMIQFGSIEVDAAECRVWKQLKSH